MKTLANTSFTPIEVDRDLLRSLLGRRLCARLKRLCVIGAHRFEEKSFVEWIFPALEQFYLFEPLASPLASLRVLAERDPRVKVFPFALSDVEGTCDFRVTNNDGESSSLLPLGTHQQLFPHVQVENTIRVETRRLDRVIKEQGLEYPDVMIVDVQGAEYQVLSSLKGPVLDHLRLIYSEVSTEAVYAGSRPLSDVEALLAPDFVNIGFAPIERHTPMHGNAVFVRREDIRAALDFTLKGYARHYLQVAQRLVSSYRRH